MGQLWEQYIMSERIKCNSYKNRNPQYYYWRTYDGQEIDLLEIHTGQITALECKWQTTKNKLPTAFAKAYPDASFTVLNNENYLDWII